VINCNTESCFQVNLILFRIYFCLELARSEILFNRHLFLFELQNKNFPKSRLTAVILSLIT
jgi:hypothetical protein